MRLAPLRTRVVVVCRHESQHALDSEEEATASEDWHEYDELNGFCEVGGELHAVLCMMHVDTPYPLDTEVNEHMEYANLIDNPERFTGYSGDAAHRIWNSIYTENCFE